MAVASEINSLEEINYKSRIKTFLYVILASFLFTIAFLNFYPIGEKLKVLLKSQMQGSCNLDYNQFRIEWLLPKIVISDLVVPARCLGKTGEALKFNHLTINFRLISFSPFGIPFLIETEMSGQPLSLYLVQGINQRLVRIKDQPLVLSRLQPLFGNFKVNGKMTVDLNLLMSGQVIKNLSLRAASKDLQVPAQNIQNFNLPHLKLNDFYLSANSQNHPRINVEKLILGNPSSPIRANFKGRIDLQEGNIQLSPMDLAGEVAFSPEFKEQLPLLDMMFQSFNQKDGFYQVRLGGMLGAPKTSSP